MHGERAGAWSVGPRESEVRIDRQLVGARAGLMSSRFHLQPEQRQELGEVLAHIFSPRGGKGGEWGGRHSDEVCANTEPEFTRRRSILAEHPGESIPVDDTVFPRQRAVEEDVR